MCRLIKEIQPDWILGENVHGLINWNGGVVFHEVQADLEAAGYKVWPYVLPACAVGAPHRRDRVSFVAFKNTNKDGRGSNQREGQSGFGQFGDIGTGNNERIQTHNGEIGIAANSSGKGLERQEWWTSEGEGFTINSEQDATHTDSDGQQRGNSEHEVNTGEGGKYALYDI